jgi:NhaP-type Na+/H+ or K+/H+ antiporter
MIIIAAFTLLILLYSLVSQKMKHTILTAPIVFTATGILLVLTLPVAGELEKDREVFLLLSELGLVLLLFSEASEINRKVLKHDALPARLLSIGMPLTILLGMFAAVVAFPELLVWEACILATILAPTDAGLGEAIVNSPRVPVRIRHALSVETGLNDGLSVPFLLFFINLASAGTQKTGWVLVTFMLTQLGLGALLGLLIGLAGGWLLGKARQKGWMAESLQKFGLVTLPLLCMIGSKPIGASMFIAAFVAGLSVQVWFEEACAQSLEFTHGWGMLFNFFVFFLFGMFFASALNQFNLTYVMYGVISLTLVRMVPVAISLFRTGLRTPTVLFMGWFGPRGLASIVLGLVYLEQESHLPGESVIRMAVMVTVFLSIFGHGLTTFPGIRLYVAETLGLDISAPEHQPVSGPQS